MMPIKRLNMLLIVGAIVGAFLTIAVTLLMDTLYADVLGGTWRDAIVKDLRNLSIDVQKDSLVVTAVFFLITAINGLFGALMGLIFTFIVFKFLNILTTSR